MENYLNKVALSENRPISTKELRKIGKYKLQCLDCGEAIEVEEDVENGEIYSCPDCGLEYEIVVKELLDEKGNPYKKIELKELVIEGEDWGE
ncbi:MAG: hypothetical protein QXQ77_02925 [Candidatus Aenigmatarchaeota archaeon]